MRLSLASLGDLPRGIPGPTYDRAALRPGIVHIGLGNFHRAHQAWYLHRLMQQGLALDWAIIGAGVRPNDEEQRKRLAAQDYLTTLVELSPEGVSAEVIGSMIGFVPVAADNGPLIAQMRDPAIRIVSLTVTEGGYYIDPATGAVDTAHADLRHDAACPETPKTAFGAMLAALRQRRAQGHAPFTCQSCDNLQGNGEILRRVLVSLAQMSDPDLAGWLAETVSFPNAMVDCIVPATGPAERALVDGLGLHDAAPVTHENFRQWVVEDEFCAGRPPWEQAGVTLTPDVHAFEAMKIRILNGGHQILANPGEILSVDTISGCMGHPLIGPLFRKIAEDEILPEVAPVPGMTPPAYLDLICTRFSNPRIVDTTRRVAFDGSARHTGFLLPVLRERLARGAPIDGLALAEALWARMCAGMREDGTQIAPNDPIWEALSQAAHATRTRPAAWLEQPQIYGDLATTPAFRKAFETWLNLIWSEGTETALRRYVRG